MHARAAAAFLALTVFFHLTSGAVVTSDDGSIMLAVSYRLVRGEIGTPEKYGLGQSLVLAPAAAAIEPARWPADPARRALDNWRVKLVPAAVGAATALAFFAILAALGARRRDAVAATVLLAVGSLVWPYARSLFAEGTVALCLLGGLLPLARPGGARPRDLALGGLALGFGALVKPVFVLPGAVVGAAILWNERRSWRTAALALGAPVAVMGALALLWNHARYGSPLATGYDDSMSVAVGWSREIARIGIPGTLLSAGKGVLFYVPLLAPALALAPRFVRAGGPPGSPGRRARSLVLAAGGGVFAVALAVHGSWWAWHGDWAWGPRLIAPYIPPLLLPLVELPAAVAGRPVRAVLAALAVAASVFVQLLGVAVHPHDHIRLMLGAVRFTAHTPGDPSGPYDDLVHSHFIPEFSPIRSHAWLLAARLRGDRDLRATCPWRGVGPPEWVERIPLVLPDGPPPLDLWVLDPALPGRGARAAVEAIAILLLIIALRADARSSAPPTKQNKTP